MSEEGIIGLIFLGVCVGIVAVIYGIYKLMMSAEKEFEQEVKQEIRQSPLIKKMIKEKPYLEGYFDDTFTFFEFRGGKLKLIKDITVEKVIQIAEEKYEEELQHVEESFENDPEYWIVDRFERIAEHMDEYMSNTPFYTLQDLYDEVIRYSKVKEIVGKGFEIDLPNHITKEASRRYLAIKQIDIRLKLQKLEKTGILEKYEKMERGKLMDKLDKTFEDWDKKQEKKDLKNKGKKKKIIDQQDKKSTRMIKTPPNKIAGIDESCSQCKSIFLGKYNVYRCEICGVFYHEPCLKKMYNETKSCRNCGSIII